MSNKKFGKIGHRRKKKKTKKTKKQKNKKSNSRQVGLFFCLCCERSKPINSLYVQKTI